MNIRTSFFILSARMLLFGFILISLPGSALAGDGAALWTNFISGNLGDAPTGIGLDSEGNVIVTGHIRSSYETIKYSGTGMPLWTNTFNLVSGKESDAEAVAIDRGGNVIVTGRALVGSTTDYATIKYSGDGVPLWTNTFNGTGNKSDMATAIVVDNNLNVFVTGTTTASTGGADFATIKYSSAGVPLWTNIFNGTANTNDNPYAITVDSGGNVIVTGDSTGIESGRDYITIKYSNTGAPLWTNSFNGAGNSDDRPTGVVTDGSGRVIVTGIQTGSGTGFDYATISYSSAGIPLWTNIFNGAANGNDSPPTVMPLAVDSNDDIFVTGYTTSGSGDDFATIKYSSDGAPVWTNIFNGTGNGTDIPTALALDGGGNVYVTGYSTLPGGAAGYATIKYSNDGLSIWTNSFGTTSNTISQARAIVVNRSGDAYVTGYTQHGVSQDYTTIKYSAPPSIYFGFITTNSNFGFNNNQFSIILSGPTDSNAVILVSTNLQLWVPLCTNQLTAGTWVFTDIVASNYLVRYYRALLQ